MTPQVESSLKPIAVRPERAGTNHVVYSSGGLIALSDVRMNVEVRRDGTSIFAQNLESPLDKVRPTERIRGLAFSPDERLLFVAAGDTIRAIDFQANQELWSYTPPRSFGFLVVSPSTLAVSGSGEVAASFDNGTIAVWSPDGSIRSMWHDNDAPRVLGFTADGQYLVGTDSFSLCIWDLATRTKVWRQGLQERAFGFALSQSLPLAATRGLHGITVWSLESKAPLARLDVQTGLPTLAFHPHAPWLAYGAEHSVTIADAEGSLQRRFEVPDASVLSIAISPDGLELAVGCSDEELRQFPIDRA